MADDITRITLKQGKATGITQPGNTPDIQGVAFNISFIASKNPTLAAAILKNYQEAFDISPSDPQYPDEDYSLALDEIKKLID